MTNLFRQAHELTRATIQDGDNYAATFTLCLRAIIADNKSHLAEHSGNTVFEAVGYRNEALALAVKLLLLLAVILTSAYGVWCAL